jgi:hypothetical protein
MLGASVLASVLASGSTNRVPDQRATDGVVSILYRNDGSEIKG